MVRCPKCGAKSPVLYVIISEKKKYCECPSCGEFNMNYLPKDREVIRKI